MPRGVTDFAASVRFRFDLEMLDDHVGLGIG